LGALVYIWLTNQSQSNTLGFIIRVIDSSAIVKVGAL
jgi:hypothetical protein